MKKTITIIIASLLLTALSAEARGKSDPTYILNGAIVENFDGSQLVGKLITDYSINAQKNIHTIQAVDIQSSKKSMTIVLKGVSDTASSDKVSAKTAYVASGQEVVFVVNGTVIKSTDDPLFKKYAGEGTTRIVITETK